jgi:1,4-alpha-glucan branching enzyme
MGAVLHDGGCTFRVWAPNAVAVWVAGDFTAPPWDGAKVALARDASDAGSEGFVYWSAFVAGVGAGAEYRFLVQNRGGGAGSGGAAPLWRMDPYGRDATSSEGNSRTIDASFPWSGTFAMPAWNDLVLYELHIGTFNAAAGAIGTFDDACARLDYLRDLGFSGVEVMPAEDFDTPTSWGYNPALPFAIDSAYAGSSATVAHVIQRFVEAAHAAGDPTRPGLAVIFDVVYNHLGPEGLGPCLWQFDGWSQNGYGGIYLYNDERAACAFGEKNRPDFGRPEVRQFFRDNAMMWLGDYQADGLRLDSTLNVRRAVPHGGNEGPDIPEGWLLLQAINDSKNGEFPWKIAIAEDLQNDDWITRPTGAGGAGFDAQWDATFRDAVREAVVTPHDADRDMGAVAAAIGETYSAAGMQQRIVYVESHDEAAIARLPDRIWPGNASSWAARKRSTLAAGIVFTSPGIPMIFQGQEFLEWTRWSDTEPLDWTKAVTFAGIWALYRDLVHIRRNKGGNTNGLRGDGIHVFHVNEGAKVIAFHRWLAGGPGDDVVVVANFSERSFPSYSVGFPRAGTWYLRFNSDWAGYSGDFGNTGYDTTAGDGPTQGLPFGGNVGLGPYSLIALSQ